MKRWQARGVVLDSDDDEALDLELEAGAESPVRKRARVEDRTAVRTANFGTDQKGVTEDATEPDWIQPKVASMYGKRSRLTKGVARQSPSVDPSGPVGSPVGLGNGGTGGIPTQSQSVSEAAEHKRPSPAADPTLHDQAEEAIFPASIDSSALMGREGSQTGLAGHEQQAEAEAQSSDSENLPDIRDLLTSKDACAGRGRHTSEGNLSSGLSSPLSERSISPPPPDPAPILRFPRPELSHGDGGSPDLQGDAQERLELSATPGDVGILEATHNGRRTFRTRNAQQLHPYEYEKMLYQKQFRERGLRPMKATDNERQAAPTYNRSSSDNQQESWQPSQQARSSPARPSSEIAYTNDVAQDNSDEDLSDINPFSRRTAFAVIERGPKRQKLAHPSGHSKRPTPTGPQPVDEFSVPPSPPPTSSGSNDNRNVGSRPAVFRFPRGMTPNQRMQQPTPNVSSSIRHAHIDFEEELPPRSRLSSVSRPRHAPITIDSSTESSASDSESDNDPDIRRLLKERKRIRGVLPASWLKIDLKAQQRRFSQSPARRREPATESPEKALPQKGVAKRITSRVSERATQQHAPIPISEDDSDDDLSAHVKALKSRQPRLQFDRDLASAAPTDFVADDRMETDYVDAMLPGSSRPKSHGASSKKRQPRITDALKKRRGERQDFAEERRAARRALGSCGGNGRASTHRSRRPTTRKPSAPLLSIVDAPLKTAATSTPLPQFVKLAMRRARAQKDHGRHSPSRKQIRLATDRDTADATAMLQAWREGTVAPRQRLSIRDRHHSAGQVSEDSEERKAQVQNDRRTPLTELSGNQQSRLPRALRTTTAEQQAGAKKLNVSRPKMRQSRIEAVPLDDEQVPVNADADVEDQSIAPSTSTEDRPTRRQPRVSQTRYRGAQLESLETDFDQGHRAAAFERRMHVLTENVARGRNGRTPAAPVQLQRFLYHPNAVQSLPSTHHSGASDRRSTHQCDEQRAQDYFPQQRLVQRPRKRMPQRLDAEARQYRQPSEPLPDVIAIDDEDNSPLQNDVSGPVLQGLGPFGTRYALDFDTLPLPLGTYFHESSFIGSGDFAASLDFAGRNLDVSTGRIRIHVDADVLDLGAWNEEVAVGLAKIPPAVSDALQSLAKDAELQASQDSPDLVLANVDYLLRSTVRYFTRCLAFSDAIDRRACAQSLQRFVEDVLETATEPTSAGRANKHVQIRCLQYATVLARQALNLCKHSYVTSELVSSGQHLLQNAVTQLAERLVSGHLDELKFFYDELRRATKREAGIRDMDTAICSVEILHHVLKGLENAQTSFWATLHDAMAVHVEHLASVPALDRIWGNLFAILPALEIDSQGILQLGSRLNDAQEDWSMCKSLLERLFSLYAATSALPGSTINDYVRATLIRCSRLQSRWGWTRCEPILYSISDFFARRGLAQLHQEESPGSPSFLQELDRTPSLEVHAGDRSFHIFLKMLASGLCTMRDRGIYPDKKIGGITYRFIPNHGRTHRKDAEVRKEDLDALRNHHDLLATIYYASPPGHRLRVDLIQNLVDHTASHREACRLNVRTWRNLAAYQASTDEEVERLVPFIHWFQELLAANIMQFRLARTEVEQDAAAAVVSGKRAVSPDTIQSIVAANQRQIAATITDALAAVKHSLKSAASLKAASTILTGTAFWQVFELFDPAGRKVFGMFEEGLEIFRTALEAQKRFQLDDGSQLETEDSQDYGDSSALQELAGTQLPSPSVEIDVLEIIHTPLAGFLSSVFGADGMLDDGLLAKVVDIWVELASATVAQGKRAWQSYISAYGSEAWSQLRDTEQRRKYTSYFLARVAESNDVDLAETGILSFWLRSLVEREANLKFQHTLTTALLNRQHGGPLLVNLPFVRPRNGRFSVSLHELRQSRLGLISSVLSNMHQHLEESAASYRSGKHMELRRTYSDMLRQMMQAMKVNYQDVQLSKDVSAADPQAHGEYVGFVQQIVSFLQQYTTEICPVDRFFTDSSAFPLPATDPTYVVGRLKGYVPKLSASSRRKELSVFVQTVSERAAVDGKQDYLVDQLSAAMIGVLERGDSRAPSVRQVLMTTVFPAYIENALSTASSWILALPVFQACGRTIPDLLYNVKMEDEDSLEAALATIAVPMRSMLRAAETVLAYPGQLMFPHVLVTMRTIFETARQSLTVMHRIGRVHQHRYLSTASSHFNECASAITGLISGNEDTDMPETFLDEPPVKTRWPDTRAFSEERFESNMRGWHARDGQYFVRRGASSVEVVMPLKDEAEEKQRLLEALQRYQQSYEAVFGARERETVVSATAELVV